METLERLKVALKVYDASYVKAKKHRDDTRQRIAELECPYKVGQDVWHREWYRGSFRRRRYQVVQITWVSGWANRHWDVYGLPYRNDGQLPSRDGQKMWPEDIATEPPKEA